MDNVDERTKLIFIVTYRQVSIFFWKNVQKKLSFTLQTL